MRRSASMYGVKSSKRSTKLGKKILRWLLILTALGICWILYVIAQIGSIERNPAARTDYVAQADVGIVLGASMWGDVPSPGLKERIEHSLADYQAGKFKIFILTGGLDNPDYKYTEAEGMANYLMSKGVPKEALLLENEATSTYENLKFSQQIMEEHGFQSALIITHKYHGNRAYEIAKALDYERPALSLTESKVLKPLPNMIREVLAYSKWKLVQIGIKLGLV